MARLPSNSLVASEGSTVAYRHVFGKLELLTGQQSHHDVLGGLAYLRV